MSQVNLPRSHSFQAQSSTNHPSRNAINGVHLKKVQAGGKVLMKEASLWGTSLRVVEVSTTSAQEQDSGTKISINSGTKISRGVDYLYAGAGFRY